MRMGVDKYLIKFTIFFEKSLDKPIFIHYNVTIDIQQRNDYAGNQQKGLPSFPLV